MHACARECCDTRRIWLLLIVNARALELLSMGIGSAGENGAALAVGGQDNRTGERNLLIFFRRKTCFMGGPQLVGARV
jgi:hypothetical protein